jgi:menaquinone-specific isochorismate synthase
MMTEVFAHYSNPRLSLACTFQGQPSKGLQGAPSMTLGSFKDGIDQASLSVTQHTTITPPPHFAAPLVFQHDQSFERQEKKRFIQSVKQALQLIKAGKFEKIVLSRRKKARLQSLHLLQPQQWMQKFFNPQFYGHQFLWHQGAELYLSVTPESLFELTPQGLYIDALAGTTSRSFDPSEDEELWQNLVNNPKERHEHQCVKDDVQERLKSLQLEGQWEQSYEPLKLEHVQHIHSLMKLEINESTQISVPQLIKALHPTAAVGARHAKNVVELLLELEGYDRGPYAAPHVIRFENQTIAIVGLRCCHVQDDEVTLFAGAGIVQGSDPEKEWLETERKCRNFL